MTSELTSELVEDGHSFGEFSLQLVEGVVEAGLQLLDLLLHQTTATRRLVRHTN